MEPPQAGVQLSHQLWAEPRGQVARLAPQRPGAPGAQAFREPRAAMRPGDAVLLRLVLLLWCGGLAVARLNDTTSRIQQEEEEAPPPAPSPVTYRLRSYQLRKRDPTGPPAAWETAPEPPELPFRGPDLNPRAKQEPQVPLPLEEEEEWWQAPSAAESVAARCGEREVTVEVNRNFLGNGQLIRPSDLTLGGCAGVDADDGGSGLRFRAELHGCGSTVTMTEGALVYSFALVYSPTPVGNTFILTTNPARVGIECRYPRRHRVSSNAVRPAWTPFASSALAVQRQHFFLRLMTEDWRSPRPPGAFSLSDVMHVEAAVLQGHHVPLRVFVDGCVATAGPDTSSQPGYHFIRDHGCLTDAKLTGAKSYFLQRSREDKLHFLLKAFRFRQDHSGAIYITCRLKATTVSAAVDSQHKACSFLAEANRWVASGGDNNVCDCCESGCGEQGTRWRRRRRGAVDAEAGLPPELQWEGSATLGPILIEDDVPEEAPLRRRRTQEVTPAASRPLVALLCGVGAALAAAALLVFMAAVIGGRLRELRGYNLST